MIEVIFPSAFVVPHERADNNPADDPAAVGPVIDPRKYQAKHEKTDHPTTHFAVNRASIGPTPAFPIIEQGANQAADGCRSADGKRHSGQVGNLVPEDATHCINAEHSAGAVLAGHLWGDLHQG